MSSIATKRLSNLLHLRINAYKLSLIASMQGRNDLLGYVQELYRLGIRFHFVGGVAAILALSIGCMPNRGKVDVGQTWQIQNKT